jgi:hypothetical protein
VGGVLWGSGGAQVCHLCCGWLFGCLLRTRAVVCYPSTCLQCGYVSVLFSFLAALLVALRMDGI